MPHRIVSLVRMTSCQIGKQGRISIYPTGTTASMLSCCPYSPPRSPRSTASHSVLQVLVVQCFCDQARSVTTVPYQFINRKPRPTVSDLTPGIRLAATSICHCRSIVVFSVPRKLAEATSSMQTASDPIYLCRSTIPPYILPPPSRSRTRFCHAVLTRHAN